jgi:proteasome lid subunit RPN8/RPN11
MLRISQALFERTLAHLQAQAPHEGVGLWAGRQGRVSEVLALPNIHARPRVAYQAEPNALLRAVQQIERGNQEVLAIYHSHPVGLARPSETDKSQAYWRVPYVIFALQSGEVKAYRLPEAVEVSLHIEP